MSDGKSGKILVIDEFRSKTGGFYKMPNGAYSHYSCEEPELEKRLAKLGKSKIIKAPLSNGKSCTDFLKSYERIKENRNENHD